MDTTLRELSRMHPDLFAECLQRMRETLGKDGGARTKAMQLIIERFSRRARRRRGMVSLRQRA